VHGLRRLAHTPPGQSRFPDSATQEPATANPHRTDVVAALSCGSKRGCRVCHNQPRRVVAAIRPFGRGDGAEPGPAAEVEGAVRGSGECRSRVLSSDCRIVIVPDCVWRQYARASRRASGRCLRCSGRCLTSELRTAGAGFRSTRSGRSEDLGHPGQLGSPRSCGQACVSRRSFFGGTGRRLRQAGERPPPNTGPESEEVTA